MFVVFKCNNLWVDYLNYTGNSCNPKDLHFKHTDGDDKQTDVIFRKYVKEKDVIALFPQIPSNPKNLDCCMSYMHVGQHGEAHIYTVLDRTVPATTYYSYRDLLAELIDIGYNPKVVDKETSEHQKQRRANNK
jgi:hypothetical protein